MSERGLHDDDERTVIVGASDDEADEVGEPTVIVDGDEPEPDERTVIVAGDSDVDERTVIVAADPDVEERTVIVAADTDTDDDATSIVAPSASASAPASTPVRPAADAGSTGLSALDEQSIRRVVRSRRLEREPLRPVPVPPGRHGPMLPGAGAGAVFTAEVRAAPAAASAPVRPAPVTTLRAEVPSVAVASRRTAVITLVAASVSVLVSVIGLVWVLRVAFGS